MQCASSCKDVYKRQKFFNAYALMNAEAIYDGQRGVEPDKRVFLLTRSGFARCV